MLEKIKNDAKKDLKDIFEIHDEIEEYNSRKILDAFIENNISESDFNTSTGYGYNDIGRDKIEDVYNKITNSNKKIAIISDDYWEKVKQEYINNLRNGIKYEVEEEPKAVYEELKNNDIITSSAVSLFGDIVEID